MYFLIENEDLLEKYNSIRDKVIAGFKKEFDSEPVYNKNVLKTKVKSYGNKVTDFDNKNFLRWNLIILVMLVWSSFLQLYILQF